MTVVASFESALKKRDAEMQRALDHAQRKQAEWPTRAYDFLVGYAQTNRQFLAWEVTGCAERMGCGAPTTGKAWGPIFRKALADGVIETDGVGRNPNRHASVCLRYRSCVFIGELA